MKTSCPEILEARIAPATINPFSSAGTLSLTSGAISIADFTDAPDDAGDSAAVVSGTLVKTGSGTLSLGGTVNYYNGGTLLVNPGASAVTSGVISPGYSVGTLTSGATLQINTGTSFQTIGSGTLNLQTTGPIANNSGSTAGLIALDGANNLLSFATATPGSATTTAVTGLGAGETLVGIDYRPATGALYGLTIDGANAGRLYVINAGTGLATFSAALTSDAADLTSPYTSLSGANFGVDFNPVPDRLRVVSDTEQNLRINVDTGAVTTDDAINPGDPALGGAAYVNAFAGATTTSLYDIDVTADRLVLQSPPNNGTLVTIGVGLGVNATGVAGFDIVTARAANGTVTHSAFAALTVGGVTGLYSIDLVGGAATSLGAIGGGAAELRGLTAPVGTPTANAFTISGGSLLRFNVATPNVTTNVGAITGLGAGENILGFDFRPATGDLYVLTGDAGNVGRLYTLNTTTAAATLATTLAADPADTTSSYTALSGASFGVDFNPVPDRLRVVSDAGQNLSINVDTGLVTTDADLNPGSPDVFAAAYLNSFAGATTTTLYDLDFTTDQLFVQNPPNNGTLTAVGNLGVNATGVGGFDIRANNQAFAALEVGGTTSLYSINTGTGAATAVGTLGTGGAVNGLALAPNGTLQVAAVRAAEDGGSAQITINRVGGSDGTVSVLFNTGGGTAAAGADYTAVSRVVTFGPGVTSQVVNVALLGDAAVEGGETFNVTLSEAQGGAVLNGSNVATVTIADGDGFTTALAGTAATFTGTTVGDTFTLVAEGGLLRHNRFTAGDAGFASDFDFDSAVAGDQTLSASSAASSVTVDAGDGADTVNVPGNLPGTLTLDGGAPAAGDVLNIDNGFFVPTGAINATNFETTNTLNPAPTLSIGDVSLLESNAGTTAFLFLVSLSAPSPNEITVGFDVSGGTATAGSDYVATSGTLTIPANSTGGTFTVTVNGDLTQEADETFTATLSNPTNATLADATATGTIANDDTSVISIADATLVEGNAGTSTMTFTVSLSNPSDAAVTVDYATADGTATAGSDYAAASGSVTIPAGQTSGTFTVTINGDTDVEPNETFNVALTNPVGGTAGDMNALGTIATDDVTISIADVAQVEGNTGTSLFVFTVTLSQASAAAVSVTYATSAGTAAAGSDYVAAGGTLTIPAGQLTGTINVTVNGDTALEGNETFEVQLTTPVGGSLVDGTALGTIVNDDLTLTAPNIATYTDVDGDVVSVRVSKGTLDAGNFVFEPRGLGVQLLALNLSGVEFSGAGVFVTAVRGPQGGDGFANVGAIAAAGLPLAAVKIAGDLGQLDSAGASNLVARSLGKLGPSTQAAGGSTVSTLTGPLGRMNIAGDVRGTLAVTGDIPGPVLVGALIGGSDAGSGAIVASGDIGAVTVARRIAGGAGAFSGSLEAGGALASVTVAGSVFGGTGVGSGSLIARTAGAVSIGHDLAGGRIHLAGVLNPTTVAFAKALGSLAIGGDVSDAKILLGYDRAGAPVNPDVQSGPATIGGDWTASDFIAGIRPTDAFYGNGDDTRIPGGSAAIISRLAAIVIGGQVRGTDAAGDHFGFEAERIAPLTTGTTKLPLTNAALDNFLLGATGDVRVREVAV